MWLLSLYDRYAPTLFYAAAIGVVVFWIMRLDGGIFRVKRGDGSDRL